MQYLADIEPVSRTPIGQIVRCSLRRRLSCSMKHTLIAAHQLGRGTASCKVESRVKQTKVTALQLTKINLSSQVLYQSMRIPFPGHSRQPGP